MILPFRAVLFVFAVLTGLITSYSVFAEEQYDRLDGTGLSRKKVDVIEWEGNLEIHVAPLGGLKGLAAKLDDRVSGKKVMVIGYRFGELGKDRPLVRRAILGVPFTAANLKAYIDPTEKDYDKLAITNQTLTAPWKPYKLDPGPNQWYPDGDERNEADPAHQKPLAESEHQEPTRVPASRNSTHTPQQPIRREEGSTNGFNW